MAPSSEVPEAVKVRLTPASAWEASLKLSLAKLLMVKALSDA